MEVHLTEADKIVLRYEVPTYDSALNRRASGSELVLVVDDCDIYTVLFKARGRDVYEINWRGNINTCLDKFQDEVGCFEHDNILDRQAVANAAGIPVS